MSDFLSFPKTFTALEKAIKITQKRQGLIAGNISNIETPNYKAKDIDFRAALGRAIQSGNAGRLQRTDPRHMDPGGGSTAAAEIIEEEGEWNGFNWTSIDTEMKRLNENNLIFRTSVEALLKKITMLRFVIREGR